MPARLLLKAAFIWLLIALLAIANGAFRDGVLTPLLGRDVALPLSGISLSLIVLVVTRFAYDFLGAKTKSLRWMIGIQWVGMTLIFEFSFGHYVVGKSWATLLQTFNVLHGDLFLLVLLVSLVAPTLIARFKHRQ